MCYEIWNWSAPLDRGYTRGRGVVWLNCTTATNRNLKAEVSHCEVLGNEQLLTCRLLDGDHLVQVRADPNMEIATGCLIHLEADPEGWRLFDADGNAIALQQPQQALETIEPQLPPLT